MRSGLLRLAVLLVLFVLAVPASAGDFPVQVDEKTLDNGLKVICAKRSGTPQTACVLAVRTGSASERAGYTGIAHFLEHMLFKGTDKIGVKDAAKDAALRTKIDGVMARLQRLEDEGAPEEHRAPLRTERDRLFAEQQENLLTNHVFKIYADAGSSMSNAMTGEDMTAFIAALPPEKIELFFWIEAERFRNPVFRQFHSEKNVVREERRLSENRPGHAFEEELQRVLFGSHPYAHPVIGYHEDLLRLGREDMRAFFDTYYTPDNMFLLVMGDVDSQRVFDLAERYFGDWKPYAGRRPRVPTVERPKSGPARVYGSGPGAARLSVAYRLPPAGLPASVEARLMAMHLGDEEGALTKRLVEERGVATSVSAYLEGKVHGSVLWIEVELKEGHAPEKVEADILEAVQALVDAPLPDETVATLARRYRARLLGSVKSDMRVGFAMLRHEVAGSWRHLQRDLERTRTLEAADVHALATTHLVPANRVVGIYETKARPVATPAVRPTEPAPRVADAPSETARPAHWTDLQFEKKPFVVPNAEEFVFTLSNGVQVVAVPDDADPAFRIEAMLRGGSADDAAGRDGTAEILAATLGLSGLPDMPREAVREKLEEIVGSYDVSAGRFALRFALDTFPQDREEGLRLFKALLLTSVPDATVAEAEAERLKARIAERATRARGLSRRSFRDLLWGENVRTRRPTSASVEAIDLPELEEALARHRDPSRMILVVSGQFDRQELAARLEKDFGSLKAGTGPVPAIPRAVQDALPTGLHVMDFDSSQGYVQIGTRTVAATDPRYPALWTLQAVLARRIFNRIRSHEGLAYQASARLSRDFEIPSLFSVVFQTKNPSVPFGIALALEEIEKIATSGPEADELEGARKRHRAGLERTFGRSGDQAGAIAELVLHTGVGLDWYAKTRDAIQGMTPEAVKAAAAEFLARDRLLLVSIGNRKAMEDGDDEHPQRLMDYGGVTAIAPPEAPAGPETPTSVALAVVRAAAQVDLDALRALVAGPFAERLAAPEAKEMLAQQARFLSAATYEVAGTVEEGDEATVTFAFELTRGEQTMQLELLCALNRIDGRWLCVGLRPKGR